MYGPCPACNATRFEPLIDLGSVPVSGLFRTRALSGLAPLPTDLNVPKLYRDRTSGRLLRFDEVLGTPAASYRFAVQYDRAGIDLVENSPEEIRDAARELLDRLEGKSLPDPEGDRLQARFASLVGPDDYGYGAASRVSASFLRRHRDLLPPEDAVPLGSSGREETRR